MTEEFAAIVSVLAVANTSISCLPSSMIEEVIRRHGGRVLKQHPDTLAAIFGIGTSDGDPAAAIESAVELKARVKECSATSLSPRFCIATGEVILRSRGQDLIAEGDSVDLAIRLQRSSYDGGVFVADSTYFRVVNEFTFIAPTEPMVKGRERPVEVYEVVPPDAFQDPPRHRWDPISDLKSLNSMYGSMSAAMESPVSSTSVSLDRNSSDAMPAFPSNVRQVKVGNTERRLATSVSVEHGGASVDDNDSIDPKIVKDWIDCTVFAPRSAVPNDGFLIQVFAHLPDYASEAAELAAEFDPSSERRAFRSLEVRVARESRITFDLVMPGLEIDDPVQSLIWRGRTEAVQFGVTVPACAKSRSVIGTVTVSQDYVPIGHLKFRLQIVPLEAGQESIPREPVGDSASRYRLAFISYASSDRDKVLSRIQMLKPLGIKYFQDVLDLEPGTRWENELYRHIDECDLFLLFWSTAAKNSKWVIEEVKYAIARKGNDDFAPPEIRPIIIEGPPPPLPPTELEHLHFNDRLIYFMSGGQFGAH